MMSPGNATTVLMLVLTVILSGTCSQSPEKFVSAAQVETLLRQQSSINEKKLQQLRQFGVDEKSGISVDFFFATDDSLKALRLADELTSLQYHMNAIHPSSNNRLLYVASGSSSRMVMNLPSINAWTDSMYHMGFRNDCLFSGWNPVTE